MDATPREYAEGDVLDGRYRLVSRIGRGGFGDVWRAEELLPDGAPFREVALKLLLAGFTDAANWAEEAKMLASFRHPSLVTIYATGIFAGRGTGDDASASAVPFVAMELLLGETLADAIRTRGRIPWRRVLGWARDTAAALDVIHARGVVHLDLKPANLFLAADGALKVLDFGIARRAGGPPPGIAAARAATKKPSIADDASLGTAQFMVAQDAFAATQAIDTPANDATSRSSTQRAVVGTPGFMAPEVIEAAEPTAAADAYALAVVVVQLTTGRLPQECPDEPDAWNDPTSVSAWLTALRAATLAGKIRDLAEDAAHLPRGVVALLRRLLSVDPRQRGVSPGQLKELFDEAWERPQGVPDPPYPGLESHGSEFEGVLFGRDDDTLRLGRELEYEPCVVLQGARRSGKSSLALAGLVPYLAHRHVDGRDDWLAVHVESSSDPDASLARALAAIDPSLEAATAQDLAAWSEASRVGIALVVDPLEALIDSGRRARIEALILAVVGERPPGLRVVATLYEARIPELLAQTPLGPALHAALRFVGPPTTAAVRDLVAAPASLAGARVEGAPEVAADVMRELRAEGARLPFVALALRAWWSTRKAQKDGVVVLEAKQWKELGGVPGALARHADSVLASQSAEDRALAEEILLYLSSSEKQLVRWPARELLEWFGPEGSAGAASASKVLEELVRQSLVVRKSGVVEIAHESLVTSWPHLEARRMADLERWVFLERLHDAAAAWHRAPSSSDLLWGDRELREVRARAAWLARGVPKRERDFLAASRKSARTRTGLRALAALALIGLATGVVFAKRAADADKDAAEAERSAAEARAYLAEVTAKSRRTEDPYHRAAYIAEAVAKGSTDGMLPLDLANAVETLPAAEFLTLESLSSPAFYWGDRFLVAGGPGPMLSIIDFDPHEGQVIDVPDLATDPKVLHQLAHPEMSSWKPPGGLVAERVPFAFDTSFVTRSVSGEVLVWRLRDKGDVALAAVAPMRCAGAVKVALRAPVVACPTDDGFARWDLRRRGEGALEHDAFQATFVEVSADGSVVAAIAGRRVRLFTSASHDRRAIDLDAAAPVSLARWSPRDRVIALVEPGTAELVDSDHADAPILRVDVDLAPVAARWDEGGVDLAVCSSTGVGAWSYLRTGARARSDAPPPSSKTPCRTPTSKEEPTPITDIRDLPEMRDRDLGPHTLVGGWKLPDGRYLTRDLLLLRRSEPAAAAALNFRGKDSLGGEEPREVNASASAVLRSGDDVVWQVGDEVHFYAASDGRRALSRKGNLLRRCPDGRVLGWAVDGAAYRVFDVKNDGTMGSVPREPGLVLAADSTCGALYTQRLDGTIVVTKFDGSPPRPIAISDGYVFDARPSASHGSSGPGLWMPASSGAIAHIDERTNEVRVVAYASPFASAVADGPAPGDLAYSDASGVVIVHPSGESDHVLEAAGSAPWEDLATAPDGATILLAGADKVAILDLDLREVVGSMPLDGRGRLSPWDDTGSILAWSFSRVGGAEGDVIPRSDALVKSIAEGVSNLVVDRGKLVMRNRR